MLPQLLLTLALVGQSPDYDLLGPRLDRIEDQLDQISRKIDQAQDLVNQILAKSDRLARLAPQAARPTSDRPWQLSSEVRNGVETIMVQDDEGQSRTFIRRIVQPSAQATQATLAPTVTVRVVRPAPTRIAAPSQSGARLGALPTISATQLQQLLPAAASPGCAGGICPLPTIGRSGVSAGCANGTCGLR